MKMPVSLVLAFAILVGCSQPSAPPPPTPAPALPPLGTVVDGKVFRARLDVAPKPPRMGKTTFTATFVGGAKPKTVHLVTAMPEMAMDGPIGDLKADKNGAFSGDFDLPMGGKYEAKLHVVGDDGSSEEFEFGFEATQ